MTGWKTFWEKEKELLFLQCYLKTFFLRKFMVNGFPKQQILDSFKLSEFADNNFEFYKKIAEGF